MEALKFFFEMIFMILFMSVLYFYLLPFLLSRRWFDKDEK